MAASKTKFSATMGNRGTIEKWEDLPPIEYYENTFWVYKARANQDQKLYKSDDLSVWDDEFKNVTETSLEMHEFYLMDQNKDYKVKNQSYVIIIGNKDDMTALYIGNMLSRITCKLNKMEFTTLFIDAQLDPALAATYDHLTEMPSVYVIYNETQKVYRFDFSVELKDLESWIVNKTFLNSSY